MIKFFACTVSFGDGFVQRFLNKFIRLRQVRQYYLERADEGGYVETYRMMDFVLSKEQSNTYTKQESLKVNSFA
jgi:hypothetical protein